MVSAANKDLAVEMGKLKRLKAVMTAIRLMAMVALPDVVPNRRNFSTTTSLNVLSKRCGQEMSASAHSSEVIGLIRRDDSAIGNRFG